MLAATPDNSMFVFAGIFAIFFVYLVVQGYPVSTTSYRAFRPSPRCSAFSCTSPASGRCRRSISCSP
jgi:hypothetical protein